MHPGDEMRKMAAVMFTDIEGYTAMVQQDESAALAKVATHRKYLGEYTDAHRGQIIQFYGDGSLSIYDSAVAAVRCAMDMQRRYGKEVPVRIGIHTGDIVMKDGTVFGDGVNIASRLQTEGIPGGILISDKVKSELVNQKDIQTVSLGSYRLKNVQRPVLVHAVSSPGITVPPKSRRLARKTKSAFRFVLPLAAIALTLLAVQLFRSKTDTPASFQEERIAIPEFEDLTNVTELKTIGKMAAHWITTEMIETVHATVVSYQSAVENRQVTLAATGQQKYTDLTGAVNVLQGAYLLIGANKDSLEFSATMMNLRTGELLFALPRVRCSVKDPLQGIQELASSVKGYWQSKGTRVMKPPKYEAYKVYLEARSLWFDDDNRAMQLLQECVALDPEFIDAYFLMLDWYYNNRKFDEAAKTIGTIKQHFPNLTDRQQNYLAYHEADNAGRNIEAFNFFLHEYQLDPKDLFVNTSGMIMAEEYVNSPQKVIEFFTQIPPDSIDLSRCMYCSERWGSALSAYVRLGKTREARKIARELRSHLHGYSNYMRIIEFAIAIGDTTLAGQVLREGEGKLSPVYSTYLYLVTGRQCQLKGNTTLRDSYARQAAQRAQDSSRMLARSYYLMEDLGSALRTYEMALLKDSSDQRIYAEMGVIYARRQNIPQARAMLEKLDAMKPPFDYGNTPYAKARIHLHLGDRQQSIDLLQQALDEGIKFLASVTFLDDPDLQLLHDDAEFRRLLKRI